MQISNIVPQLRTTDLAASVDFYTTKLGFTLEFLYDDFYAGVRYGEHVVHLKLVDAPDPQSLSGAGPEQVRPRPGLDRS